MKESEPEDWAEVFDELRGDDGDCGNPGAWESDSNPDIPPDEPTIAVRKLDPQASLVRRGRRLLGKPHGTGNGPLGDPSVAEIRAMAAAIAAEWNPQERRSRSSRWNPEPVETKRTRIGR